MSDDRRKLRNLLSRWLGERGERAALRYLKARGYRLILRGYRSNYGEVDLIARDQNVLVFVEVKARRRGDPAEAVTVDKQRKLTLTALHFLKRHRLLEQACRFDVIAIVWPVDRGQPEIEHYRHAFEAVGLGQFFR